MKIALTVSFWLSDNFMDDGALLMNGIYYMDMSTEIDGVRLL